MTTRIKKVCNECGSTDLRIDAWATWDEDAQKYILEETFGENIYCESCDCETSIKEIEQEISFPKTLEGFWINDSWEKAINHNILAMQKHENGGDDHKIIIAKDKLYLLSFGGFSDPTLFIEIPDQLQRYTKKSLENLGLEPAKLKGRPPKLTKILA